MSKPAPLPLEDAQWRLLLMLVRILRNRYGSLGPDETVRNQTAAELLAIVEAYCYRILNELGQENL